MRSNIRAIYWMMLSKDSMFKFGRQSTVRKSHLVNYINTSLLVG
jgi:hypothetical protein